MNKIIKFFKNAISPARKKVEEQRLCLEDLQNTFSKIKFMENQVEAVVLLFQVTSPLCDINIFNNTISYLKARNCNSQIDALVKNFCKMQNLINNHLNRNIYGMNRTSFKEQVNHDNVFIGDKFGLWTKPASFWLSNKEKLEKDFLSNSSNSMSTWDAVNSGICKKFVLKNTDIMIQAIDQILFLSKK